MRLTDTKGLGVHSFLKWRAKSRDQPTGRCSEKREAVLVSKVFSTGSLLVTTDIERVSHPPCGHNSIVAEQGQSMIYQPG